MMLVFFFIPLIPANVGIPCLIDRWFEVRISTTYITIKPSLGCNSRRSTQHTFFTFLIYRQLFNIGFKEQ